MALKRIKLGRLIEKSELKNNDEIYDDTCVRGISINKCFAPTKADAENIDLKCFKVVKPNYFAFNTATSRNGEKISIAFNDSNETIIVSSLYDVFCLSNYGKQVLDERYLYIFFNRSEFDRYSRTDSWGSAREYFRFGNMCDVEIELPDLETQRKFVAVYLSMIDNQKSYEKGLDDLKLTCDGYIENLKKKYRCERIGPFIKDVTEKNENEKYGSNFIKGISIKKEFADTKADITDLSPKGYNIVRPNQFAFNPNTARMGEKICVALNQTNDVILVSSIYPVFEVIDTDKLDPRYLMMFFQRSEFDRYVRFNSWGSARETFNYSDFEEVEVPIPPISIQRSIADIYDCYLERKSINEMLKNQIKDICPILIKGSIEEAR